MDKTQSWRTFFVALFAIAVLSIGFAHAAPQWGPRDINLNAFGTAGYLNNTITDNLTFGDTVDVNTQALINVNVLNASAGDADLAQNRIRVNCPQTAGTNCFEVYSNGGDGKLYERFVLQRGAAPFFGFINVSVRMSNNGVFTPDTNNTGSLGTNALKWSRVSAVINDIGDLREDYLANSGYTYVVGDVVALDPATSEIKPVLAYSDRIIGVVAELPRWEYYNDNNGTLVSVWIPTHSIVIYGKYSAVKVVGTVKKGDYLVASGTQGVASSMYNVAHPLPALSSTLVASTNPNVYNIYAKLLPSLGMAMEDYNSTSVGTIKVLVGK